MNTLLGIASVQFLVSLPWSQAKWVEGRVDTKNNWAFLSRFCFISKDGQFEYLIEFDRDMGLPNLLLYYDDDSQWPSVYHSSKTCKEREQVLNKNGQNQIIKLSHWYPDTEVSGCMVTRAHKELPASKSTTTPKPPNGTTKTPATTSKPKNSSKNEPPVDPAYYDQFLKTTTAAPKTTISDSNSTIWYEIPTTEEGNTTAFPEEELWESIGPERNGSHFDNLKDAEWLFESRNKTGRKRRSVVPLYERIHRRRLNAESKPKGGNAGENIERLVVSCHNSRRFVSARERWWFIAISNCEGNKGLDVRYKFLMTNGPEGDFWHEHFSADEFHVLPVLLTYTFAYILVMIAVVMCSVELKSRHLLHSTYKLFLVSIVSQHIGIILQAMAYLKYASNGVGSPNARVVGQFHCGVSESVFLLLLVLMAKGYTITRGRLKPGFAVKLTIFMCGYIAAYVALFVYQAKAFDPGQVLYLYESPAGYGLIVLRVVAWFVFAYSTLFTVRKYPEKNMFYCPFFICGTLWFYAGPLFILTANSYIDKWVRESVVTAVLLFITFSGHLMFLILTLPVFANKNFPYHVRTTQIGVMELTGSSTLDGFGPNAYHPANGVPQTVIIPLTRRTEELIGNMYTQYMATAPPLSLENGSPKLNGVPRRIDLTKTLIQQDSTETNTSDDIKPYLAKDEVENHTATKTDLREISAKDRDVKSNGIFTVSNEMGRLGKDYIQDNMDSLATESLPSDVTVDTSRSELPNVLRSRRNILEPIKMDVPSWSLAKGPCVVAMQKKKSEDPAEIYSSLPPINGNLSNGNAANGSIKKVPPVRNGLQPSSGEISTIHEGHIQSYKNSVSKATIDLFNANNKG